MKKLEETPPTPPVNGGEYEIIPLTEEYRAWARHVCEEWWGGVEIMSRFVWFDTAKLDGFVAVARPPLAPPQAGGNRKPIGLATYCVANGECELISLNSFVENCGVGDALLDAVKNVARSERCNRIFLTTSNDNLRALQFYQKRGMRIVAVHVGAIDAARVVKPGIPTIGDHGIPCRDELELEEKLDYGQAKPKTAEIAGLRTAESTRRFNVRGIPMTKENFEAEESRIFRAWELDHNHLRLSQEKAFIKDGIIFYDEYWRQHTRVLILAKEANIEKDAAKGLSDLREFYRTKPIIGNDPVWMRWASDILTPSGGRPSWGELLELSKDRDNEESWLRGMAKRVAFVDLKKSGGEAKASRNLRDYVRDCCKHIRAQLELYDPAIMICAGTYDLVRSYVLDEEAGIDKETRGRVRYFVRRSPLSVFVESFHFSLAISSYRLHYSLVDAVDEIRTTCPELGLVR
jgi:GNAT superfamily N-acetyltransferase